MNFNLDLIGSLIANIETLSRVVSGYNIQLSFNYHHGLVFRVDLKNIGAIPAFQTKFIVKHDSVVIYDGILPILDTEKSVTLLLIYMMKDDNLHSIHIFRDVLWSFRKSKCRENLFHYRWISSDNLMLNFDGNVDVLYVLKDGQLHLPSYD